MRTSTPIEHVYFIFNNKLIIMGACRKDPCRRALANGFGTTNLGRKKLHTQ